MPPGSNPKLEAEAHLRQVYRSIEWDEPITIIVGEIERLGCRYCIALVGLKGSEAHLLSKTRGDFADHLRDVHSRPLE